MSGVRIENAIGPRHRINVDVTARDPYDPIDLRDGELTSDKNCDGLPADEEVGAIRLVYKERGRQKLERAKPVDPEIGYQTTQLSTRWYVRVFGYVSSLLAKPYFLWKRFFVIRNKESLLSFYKDHGCYPAGIDPIPERDTDA